MNTTDTSTTDENMSHELPAVIAVHTKQGKAGKSMIGTLLKREIDGEEVNIQEAIKSIYADNMLDLLPSDADLAFHHYWLDKVSLANNAFEVFMKRHTEFFSTYEVIVVDTTSSSSKLTRSLLNAAKSEIVSPLKLNGQYNKSLDELSHLLADINEKRDEESLVTRLKDLAMTYPRYGYLLLHGLLKREGRVVNKKRTYRLYTEQGLQVRTKQRKKLVRPRLVMDRPTRFRFHFRPSSRPLFIGIN